MTIFQVEFSGRCIFSREVILPSLNTSFPWGGGPWDTRAPTKVSFFVWREAKDKILTEDNYDVG